MLAAAAVLACLGAPAGADDFPAVTAEQRALIAAPGAPEAAAVFLYKNAEFKMLSPARGEPSSRLTVTARIKVLKDEGRQWGEISLPHSSRVRLQGFKGRTVLPDGRVAAVPKEAKFTRRLSASRRRYLTSLAFPSVERGAILDYRYEVVFDSIYYLEPWSFSEEIPVLHSEIVYDVPGEIRALAWRRDPMNVGVQTENARTRTGQRVKVWAEKLPPVREEPYGPPFADLATQFMLVPSGYADLAVNVPLLESWASTCEIVGRAYDEARRRTAAAAARARALAASARSGGEKARALFEFVRDSVVTELGEGIILREGASVDGTLASARGDSIEKALLLESMLKAVDVPARLVWAASHADGQIDPNLPTPSWFARALVAVEIDGRRSFLDPSEPVLGFGQLSPELEGSAGLIHDAKKPKPLVLPEGNSQANRRQATLDLAVDALGRVRGSGDLLLTGHAARDRMKLAETSQARTAAWQQWLGESFAGFRMEGVKVAESPEAQQVRVIWTMVERDDAVLGDEVSLQPSRPLGPMRQPFPVPASQRRSSVFFDFPKSDEVELRLHWEPGWKLDAAPRPAEHVGPGAALSSGVEIDLQKRSLIFRRRLEVRARVLESREDYEGVRKLFDEVEKSDAQPVVLLRR